LDFLGVGFAPCLKVVSDGNWLGPERCAYRLDAHRQLGPDPDLPALDAGEVAIG
jgi:hypothetical protein